MDKPVIAEIFSQGDEVITGQIADTNAAWLAERLDYLGFDIARHSAVGDRLERLIDLLREIAERADLCVCTGGLGPTIDDLTAEAVATAFDRPLKMDAEALVQIEGYFAQRGHTMPPINRKQALLPQGARRLDNSCGTAPGFALLQDRCLFAFLPGVPSEMRTMFEQQVEPSLTEHFRLHPSRLITLRTIGVGESSLQEKLQSLDLPHSVRLGFRAAMPENEVKLLFPPEFPVGESASVVERTSHLLGDVVFAVDGIGLPGGHLASVVVRLLRKKGATLAVAENASAGQLAWQCRGEPSLLQSLVSSDPARLWHLLECDPSTYTNDPVRTGPALATRLRQTSGASYALVNLGHVPASDTASAASSPSSITIALDGHSGVRLRQCMVAGPAERRRKQVAALSLDLLRRALIDFATH